MSQTQLDGAAVQQIVALAQAAMPKHTTLPGVFHKPVLVWNDKALTDIEHLLAAPVCKRGRATFGDAVAFADYVNAHRTHGLIIFGDVSESGGSFTAILDGHVPAVVRRPSPEALAAAEDSPVQMSGSVVITSPGHAQWSEHIVHLPLTPTPEWARWLSNSGKTLEQEQFAVFLEENAADVIVPPAEVKTVAGFPVPPLEQLPNSAELMSVALTLQTKTDVEFSSKMNRQNGQTQLTYLEKLSATHAGAAEGKMGIPEFFCLAVAPFRGGAAQVVLCRLRFRAANGRAKFEYQLIRPHKIVEHAWKMVAADIAGATGENVMLGKVELPGRGDVSGRTTLTSGPADDRGLRQAMVGAIGSR
jgi:uncharacterized protein YfdQ (DUF2303 family)